MGSPSYISYFYAQEVWMGCGVHHYVGLSSFRYILGLWVGTKNYFRSRLLDIKDKGMLFDQGLMEESTWDIKKDIWYKYP